MPERPDIAAKAALAQQVTRPVWFGMLDFANGPLRATTLPYNVQMGGPELITNGDFAGGTTGWTAFNDAVLSISGGALRITNGHLPVDWGFLGTAYQAFTTEVGKTYKLRLDAGNTIGGGVPVVVLIGNSPASGTIYNNTHPQFTSVNVDFVATSTTTYVSLQVGNPTDGWWVELDNVKASLSAPSTDPDLIGQTYYSLSAQVQDFGQVHNQESGSETLSIMLSGQLFPDDELLDTIADEANWRGRKCKFWQGQRDANGAFTGTIWLYHSGWMSALSIGGGGAQQYITLQVEGYLAMFGRASQRTYMDQGLIDPNDLSPQLVSTPGSFNNGGSGGSGASGGSMAGRFSEGYYLVDHH